MSEADKKNIAEIARKHNLALVVLFGSQATGHTHKMSDVDIGYISEKEIDYRENYDITLELAEVFKNPDVELVNLDNLAPEFKKQIADTGIVLYEERKSIFDFYKIHANRSYIDTKPLRLYRDARLKDFVKEHA